MARIGRTQEGTLPALPARVAPAQTPGLPPAGGCFPHILGTGLQKNRIPAAFGPSGLREGAGKALGADSPWNEMRGEASAPQEERRVRRSGAGQLQRGGGTAAPGRERARSRPVESGNPSRSCSAFVGLSWTLNVFLINRLSVSKPPRGVYSPAIKWERGISLPPALPGNIPRGLEGGRKPLRREQCSYPDSCLELPFKKSFTYKGKDKLVVSSFPAPLSPS